MHELILKTREILNINCYLTDRETGLLWVHCALRRHNFRRYGKILPTTDDCSDPDHWIELVEIYRLIRRKKNVTLFFSAHDVDPPKTPQKTPQVGPCASSGVPRLGYRRPSRRAAGAKIFGRAAPLAAHERLRLADARERRPRQHGGGHGGLEQQQGEEREEDDQ